MNREQEAEMLKKDLARVILDDNKENPIHSFPVPKALFIEMAILFIAKHGK